jgi:aryl-alcohol dehydrogenase-like predicted oxidoreductase
MKFKQLGRTDLQVSLICLGSMNWGEQNTEADAHEQMDYAVEQGINFIDTAELYPIPPNKESQGRTESYIGTWMKEKKNRSDLIIASKVTGKSPMTYVRGGDELKFDRKNITAAIEGSLKRLQTDYIDLYQLHWPDRRTNVFGVRNYTHDQDDQSVPLLETLEVLADFVKQGKIRHVGLSNETAWGVTEFLRLSRENDLPRMQSIQNPYSLIMRQYESALAEIGINEDVGLLVYSPLATGVLSGKYLDGKMPKGSRMDYSGGRSNKRYNPDHAQPAIQDYVDLAKKHDLDPAQMALAFVNSRQFVTSNIIGATTMEQLKSNIASVDLELNEEVLDGIEQIQTIMPNPLA